MHSVETFQFNHPFTCLIAGPTQSGKTYFVRELLKHAEEIIYPCPERIIWFAGEHQEGLNLPPNVEVRENFTGLSDIEGGLPTLIILDDLMEEVGDSQEVVKMFTKGSHHKNISVIFIVQNLFHKGKSMRTVSLNAHYIVLMKNPRGIGQVKHLASQLSCGVNFLTHAYKLATLQPHGYLLLDFTQKTVDDKRVLSHILPGEEGYYYVPEKKM